MTEATVPSAAQREAPWLMAATLVVIISSTALLYLSTSPGRVQLDSFVPLADAFLHGRLYIDQPMPWLELVPRPEGGWYSPFPPMPALLVLPFVAIFGLGFDQGIVAAVIGGANVALVWLVLLRMNVNSNAAGWLTVAFAIGSVHWWAASEGTVWLFALVTAVFFSLCALFLAVRRELPLLAGIFLGMAAASRLPVAFTVILYIALYGGLQWRLPFRMPPSHRLRAVALVLLGAAIPGVLVAAYNVARFGNIFEFGYDLIPGVLDEPWYSEGTNSLAYIPRNLHAMFLKSFDFVEQFPWWKPSWYGTSLLITTPVFLWLLKARSRRALVVFGWIAVLAALLPVITHGGVGFTQFGYRRILDVAPVLWVLLGWVFRHGMSFEAKLAVAIGVLVNAYGIWVITYLNFVGF
jgi:hypothetical protein